MLGGGSVKGLELIGDSRGEVTDVKSSMMMSSSLVDQSLASAVPTSERVVVIADVVEATSSGLQHVAAVGGGGVCGVGSAVAAAAVAAGFGRPSTK